MEKNILNDGRYGKARRVKSGPITSDVIAGFTVLVRAIFEDKANLVALRRLLS